MAQENNIRSWADESEDIVQTKVGEDGIKYVTEVKIKDGKRYKVTKKVRTSVKENKTSKRVEDRKTWKRFGMAAPKRGKSEDLGVTSIGDPISFEFVHGKSAALMEQERKRAFLLEQLKADLADLHQKPVVEKKEEVKPKEKTADVTTPGKYVPPSVRARAAAAASSGAPTDRYEEGITTVRVSNLPAEATEDDLQYLFRKVGLIHRTFIARYPSGDSKCFGFVRFSSELEAQRAIEQFNGLVWDNLVLSVELSDR